MVNQRTIVFYTQAMQMGWMYAIKQTCHGFGKEKLDGGHGVVKRK